MARRSTRPSGSTKPGFNHPSLSYETPTQLRRFRAGLTLIVSTLLVAGVWTGLWFAASSYVKAQVTHWAEAQVAAGGPSAFETLELSGFPSRIVVTLSKPRYRGPLNGLVQTGQMQMAETAAWQGETMTVSARPWLPWHLHLAAPGRHELTWADGQLSLVGTVAELDADVVLGDVWPQALSLHIQDLAMSGYAPVVMDSLKMDLTHNSDVQASGDGLTLSLSGSNVTVPLHGGWGLGNTFESLDVGLRVTRSEERRVGKEGRCGRPQ